MDTLFDLGMRRRTRGELFAEDFDLPRHRAGSHEPGVITPGFSAADIAAARAEAWAEGHEAGSAEANASTQAAIRGLLESLATTLHEARAELTEHADHTAEAVARLLLDSLATALPALCARHGEAELLALMRTILPALAREPAVTIRLNPAHTPALMRELDRLDPELAERMQLVPVEAIPLGDVRASWRDGAAQRDAAGLWAQVRAVLEPAGLLSREAAPATVKEAAHAD